MKAGTRFRHAVWLALALAGGAWAAPLAAAPQGLQSEAAADTTGAPGAPDTPEATAIGNSEPAAVRRASADGRDQRRTTVGMRGRIDGVVLPGPPLVVRKRELDAPLVLRIVATWPHGSDTRYDLEYSGLEPGSYDLSEWLATPEGAVPAALPRIAVDVVPVLPLDQVRPRALDLREPARLGGYRRALVALGVLWAAGLAWLVSRALRGGRRERAEAAATPPPTLAERLRPHVERAVRGELDAAGKAELERLLVAHWRERLDLGGVKASRAIAELRAHDEAGRLLRQLEAWLHRAPAQDAAARSGANGVAAGLSSGTPDPAEATDVEALLAPYRNVPARPLVGGGSA